MEATTSASFGMPGSAIATGAVRFVIPLAGIAPALVQLVKTGTLDAAPAEDGGGGAAAIGR